MKLTPGMPFYGVKMLDHTCRSTCATRSPWWRRQTNCPSAPRWSRNRWLPDMATFARGLGNGPPAMAVMSPETYLEL